MCTEISLGIQMYSVAKLLHQSIILSMWEPGLTADRIHMFEIAEQSFLRKISSAHSKTPVKCLYLELGVIPLRFHLMARRICYFQTVMQRDDDEITKKIVIHQKEDNHPGDFYPQVANDMQNSKYQNWM